MNNGFVGGNGGIVCWRGAGGGSGGSGGYPVIHTAVVAGGGSGGSGGYPVIHTAVVAGGGGAGAVNTSGASVGGAGGGSGGSGFVSYTHRVSRPNWKELWGAAKTPEEKAKIVAARITEANGGLCILGR